MILEVLKLPDSRLRTIAAPIENIDDSVRQLAQNMLETMQAENGIGLAGTQVNAHQRIFVADISKEGTDPRVFINPEIINKQGEREYEEGCLSVPEYNAKIIRADSIVLSYQTENGEIKEEAFDGLMATCIQHEIDHLNGIVFIDYLSKLKQKRVLEKLKKLKMHKL